MAKFYYLFSALLLLQIQGIFGAMNVTIGDIENNNLSNISGGNGNNTSPTSFICLANSDKKCIARNDPNYIIPKSNGKDKIDGVFTDLTTLDGYENNNNGAIIEACNEKSLKDGKCQTRKCAVNEDCLSGICKSNSCVTNPEHAIMECEEYDGMIVCSRYLQEKCVKDSDCAGRCKKFLCTYRFQNKLNTNPLVYSSAAIGIGIFCILLFCSCLCCPRLWSWSVKEKRNNNPPVVV